MNHNDEQPLTYSTNYTIVLSRAISLIHLSTNYNTLKGPVCTIYGDLLYGVKCIYMFLVGLV